MYEARTSSMVAALPSWKYGAVSMMLRSVGTRNFPMSAGLLVNA